jgi:hypothetical protein
MLSVPTKECDADSGKIPPIDSTRLHLIGHKKNHKRTSFDVVHLWQLLYSHNRLFSNQ